MSLCFAATVGFASTTTRKFLNGDPTRLMPRPSYKLTYLPHEAVAEVSKDKEPIGRGCGEFNWFESQLMSDSSELRVK